jgi:hypothetical protein
VSPEIAIGEIGALGCTNIAIAFETTVFVVKQLVLFEIICNEITSSSAKEFDGDV